MALKTPVKRNSVKTTILFNIFQHIQTIYQHAFMTLYVLKAKGLPQKPSLKRVGPTLYLRRRTTNLKWSEIFLLTCDFILDRRMFFFSVDIEWASALVPPTPFFWLGRGSASERPQIAQEGSTTFKRGAWLSHELGGLHGNDFAWTY